MLRCFCNFKQIKSYGTHFTILSSFCCGLCSDCLGISISQCDYRVSAVWFSDVFRNFVGASKIAISALLLTGIWYVDLTPYAAIGMAAFMLAAQLSHLRVQNPFLQRLPSLSFFLMSVFVALFHFGVI